MYFSKFIPIIMLSAALSVPYLAQAQSAFEVSGWIPYWRSEAGVAAILPELDQFTEVNPFMYTVKQDGTLHQASSLTSAEWMELRVAAKEKGIRFIPTVMWSGSDAIHETLSDPVKRQAHVQAIAQQVFAYNLDGIDIDYEAKYARTRDAFSAFLKELQEAIGYNKWVMCTVESRTPLDSRYSSPESIPAGIEYSNDFTAINQHCDRVRIMAYDQGRIDLKLNNANEHPYIPVADVDWVRKTIELIAEEVDKDKLVIGVPTYGYEYDMFQDESGITRYSRLWSFNPGYADEVAQKLNLTPTRSGSGELMLTYPARDSIDPAIPLPEATRVMSWSDAQAIQEKAALAEELGVRGIALFKIDGGEDPALRGVLAEYAGSKLYAKTSSATLAEARAAETGSSSGNTESFTLPDRNLSYGAVHEDVRQLQKFLNETGFTVAESGGGSPGNETTFFGPATTRALARYQAANGISPAIGYYGPITRATIQSAYNTLAFR